MIVMIIFAILFGFAIGYVVVSNEANKTINACKELLEYLPWIPIKSNVIPNIDSESQVLIQYSDGDYDCGPASRFIWKNSVGNTRKPIKYFIIQQS